MDLFEEHVLQVEHPQVIELFFFSFIRMKVVTSEKVDSTSAFFITH